MTTIKKEGTEDMEDNKSTCVRYVSFNGKGGSFGEWKIKTLSLARKKKFDMYLTKKWILLIVGTMPRSTMVHGIN